MNAPAQSRRLGQPLQVIAETTSTNDRVKEAGAAGAPEGLTIIADRQTQGRGRRGRVWQSPPGLGLYMSVLLRPDWPAQWAGNLAMLGGVAVLEALAAAGVPNLALKWPNDVLARGRKIAGILIEPRIAAGRIEFAVIGIGVNFNQSVDDWAGELHNTATSCRLEGVCVTRDVLAEGILGRLSDWYARVGAAGFAELQECWRRQGGGTEMPVIDGWEDP